MAGELINGREYSWDDISIYINTTLVTRIQGITYKAEQEKSALYGKGNKPLCIQSANKSYSGSIKLLQSQFETLELYAKQQGKTLLDLSFDINVSYGEPTKGDPMITDAIIGAQFTSAELKPEQGNTELIMELPFIALDIQFQI